MKIGSFDCDRDVLIVAEIGNNHEGNFDVAQELVRQAAASGVHAVKFQTFRTELFVSPRDPARFQRLKSFELPYDQFAALRELAHALGLLFLSTPLDLESATFLASQVDAFKIASGDNNFYPLLARVCRSGKPVIVSSGLSDLDHLRHTKRYIQQQWAQRQTPPGLAVLHCVTSYPAPPAELNLAAIPWLAEQLDCPVGYSDHTLGMDACLAAAALGACIVEKHFTLDKNFSAFRDHQLSADPPEMRQLVEGIHRVRAMRGRAEKAIQPCEHALVTAARRSIVAARDLPAMHRLAGEDLLWIRPGDGLSPGDEDKLLGRKLRRAMRLGELILTSDVV